ncbi:myb-like protein U isoform X2 [Cloeon dipterum]|uniref:myb-like protein U isoform X2 n=1 Tax=Cloeon dipterum TaxID=197152 RepID=UPI00321FC24D
MRHRGSAVSPAMFASVVLFSVVAIFGANAQVYVNPDAVQSSSSSSTAGDLVTQTVYGFLDFTTTIGNTVMVFSPQSAPAAPEPTKKPSTTPLKVIETKPTTSPASAINPSKTVAPPSEKKQVEKKSSVAERKKQVLSSVVEVRVSSAVVTPPPAISSRVEIKEQVSSRVEVRESSQVVVNAVPLQSQIVSSVVQVRSSGGDSSDNLLSPPESYDFLQVNPLIVPEPTSKTIKQTFKLGIVGSQVDTVVLDDLTTVHETRTIGTMINGKYSTVLKSTSSVKADRKQHIIIPTATQTPIHKTQAPTYVSENDEHLEPSPAGAAFVEETAYSPDEEQELNTKPLRRSAVVPGRSDFLSRLQQRTRSITYGDDDEEYEQEPPSKFASSKRPAKARTASLAVRPTSSYQRRGYKARTSSVVSSQEERPFSQTTSNGPLNKFKLNRPAGRWQYKTTAKPRVPIRPQVASPVKTSAEHNAEQSFEESDNVNGLGASHAALTSPTPGNGVAASHGEDSGATEASPELQAEGAEEHHVHEPAPAQETIRVEISTPADFSDVYYEIATIKSPYTFQVGSVKNTRYITVTSTFEKNLVTPTESPEILPTEPLTENILATSTQGFENVNQLPVDASIATLPPIVLATNVETPPLETVTETFNTTQLMLKTHVLPVIQQGGTDTKLYTLVQSYHITRFVTAIKTLPPSDAFQFLPSRALNEFNTRLDEAGSELHELELSENDQDGEDEQRRLILPPDLDLAQIGGDLDLDKLPQRAQTPSLPSSTPEPPTTPASPQYSPEQLQQLALLRYLNPLAPVPAITTSKPVVKKETIFESHVIPLFNGLSTVYTTISRPVSTVAKTEYEVTTIAPTGLLQPQFTVTSQPVVTQTMVTQINSKVIKLNFGAKTVFTTLYESTVVPTVLTTYLTTQIPVQPTAAPFPNFFPGAFPGFPFVG